MTSSTRPPATRRSAQRLETRELVFQAAVAEMRLTGSADADVAAITAAAGVARGTFYFHFPTRGHVVAELKARTERVLCERLDPLLGRGEDLRAAFAELIGLVLEAEQEHGRALFAELATYQDAKDLEVTWTDHALLGVVVRLIEQGKARGEVAAEVNPESAGLFFLLGMHAVLALGQVPDEHRSQLIDEYLTSQLRALEPR